MTQIVVDILEYLTVCKCKVMLGINNLNILSYLFKGYIKGEYEKIYQLSKKKAMHLIICNYDIESSAACYRAYISTVALDGSQVGER